MYSWSEINVKCNLYSDNCEIVKGDSRSVPGPMNHSPGTAINILPDLKTTISGRIVNVTYYAISNGTVFVSFWESTDVYGQFRLVTKIFIEVTITDRIAVSITVLVFNPCITVYIFSIRKSFKTQQNN